MFLALVLTCLLASVDAKSDRKLFMWFKEILDGHSCPKPEITFEESKHSLQSCARRCGLTAACTGFFYSEMNNTCQGCDYVHSINIHIYPPRKGTECFYETLGWFSFNGSRYILNKAYVTLDQAKSFCEALGGYVVNIGSEEENEFLVNFMIVNGEMTPKLIGLTDKGSHGNWRWMNDGSTPVYTKFSPTDTIQMGDDHVFFVSKWFLAYSSN